MGKYKNQKAITTCNSCGYIIILLILVGNSISTLTNIEIFQKAEDTKSARWKIFYADTNNIYL